MASRFKKFELYWQAKPALNQGTKCLLKMQVASMMQEDPEDRVDPMSRIFPRVTKCTFKKFGLNLLNDIFIMFQIFKMFTKRSFRNPTDP